VLNKIIFMVLIGCSLSTLAGELNDPTKPGVRVSTATSGSSEQIKPTKPQWILKSIKISGSHRSAIINQQSYRIGELVGEQRIAKILSNQVIFSSGKRLNLFDDSFVSLATKGLSD